MTASDHRAPGSEMLYGAKAIAAFLNVTRRQAFHMIEANGLPVFKVGKIVCARPAAVRTWLAEREAAGRKPA